MIGDEEMITERHFDADDNFIHRCCECGEEAPFGFRVSLRRGTLGTWYCANTNRSNQRRRQLTTQIHRHRRYQHPTRSALSTGRWSSRRMENRPRLAASSFNKTNEEAKR